jgi:hypothetical protein
MWRRTAPRDFSTVAAIMLTGTCTYSAWLTSIAFCSTHDNRSLLIAPAVFFPVGLAQGIGVWLGGW